MTNTEKLNGILKTIEENHINLYHDVSKEQVRKHIESINGLDNMSDLEFDYEMLKLFALFRDAHTAYRVPFHPIDKKIIYINGSFYLLKGENKYQEILKFANLDAAKVAAFLQEIACYETQEWLGHKIERLVSNGYILKMLGLMKSGKMEIEVAGGEKVSVALAQNEVASKAKRLYEYKIADGILYLRYRLCVNDPELPFKDFVEEIKEEVVKHQIKKYILDIRCNGGGNCDILNPFQNMVRDLKMNGVLMINEGVFSSARIDVARFKKEFNVLLVGSATGGAAKSYGLEKQLEFGGKRFSVSTRIWDFSDVFGYTGAIQPDINVPLTIEDIESQKDPQLAAALDALKNI